MRLDRDRPHRSRSVRRRLPARRLHVPATRGARVVPPPTAHTPGGEGFWVVTRHADVVAAGADVSSLSSHTGPGRDGGGGTILEDLPGERRRGPSSHAPPLDRPVSGPRQRHPDSPNRVAARMTNATARARATPSVRPASYRAPCRTRRPARDVPTSARRPSATACRAKSSCRPTTSRRSRGRRRERVRHVRRR